MITKKEDVANCKIWIGDNPELNRKVQDRLYELGYEWCASDKYANSDSNSLYTRAGCITHGYDKVKGASFYSHEFREITVEELLDMEETYRVSKSFILEAHKAACSEWKRKIENEVPDVFPKTYKYGDIVMNGVEEYIIANPTTSTACLIQIKGCDVGNRYKDPIQIDNRNRITQVELDSMSGGLTVKLK